MTPVEKVFVLTELVELLRDLHAPHGDRACRQCLVADGYSRCPTGFAIDEALALIDKGAP